jgi:hypothetical protein
MQMRGATDRWQMSDYRQQAADLVDQRRVEAARHNGVTYDPKRNKFVAAVRRSGRSLTLGRYDTAAEAGAAVASVEGLAPPRKLTFRQQYASWLETLPRLDDNRVENASGRVFRYDEQDYTLRDVTWRRVGRRAWPFASFETACKTCGQPFSTLTPLSTAAVGIARNCEEHRKVGGLKKRSARAQGKAQAAERGRSRALPSPPSDGRVRLSPSLVLAIAALLSDLALVHDRMRVDDVVSAAGSREGIPARTMRAILRDGYGAPGVPNPVVQDGWVLLA